MNNPRGKEAKSPLTHCSPTKACSESRLQGVSRKTRIPEETLGNALEWEWASRTAGRAGLPSLVQTAAQAELAGPRGSGCGRLPPM